MQLPKKMDRMDLSSVISRLAMWTNGLLMALMLASPAQAEPVRGVWVAGPQHNRFWDSREAMRQELAQYKAAGLNTVYVVAWMGGRTLYPSARLAKLGLPQQLAQLGQRDVFAELTEDAAAQGLRVIAWLEFGFASHHQAQSKTLLALRPDWAALGRDGKPVVKNGFHWMNGFDPEVQQLLIDLSTELLQRYPKLTGVQGDDRLPAQPSAAGYHPSLLKAYGWQSGQPLPEPNEPAWLQWRADQLTAFLRRWRAAVKAVRADAVLSLSPSPYPWGLQEYLQDWPAWLREGLADELLPQLYRRDRLAYQRLLAETQAHIPAGQQHKVFPGVLLALGPEVVPSPELLAQWIADTRAAGFQGEVYFHSTGVAPRAAVLREAYGLR